MSFHTPTCEQAAIKASIYGPAGSGKTFSALLFAEGIALATGKRIAFVDTERGTTFYSKAVAARKFHADKFDFDVIHTRSLTEIQRECRELDPKVHGIIIIDSISHVWDAAIAAYTGPKTRAGTIPMYAWTKIKAPYKALVKFLIDSPFHLFLVGRQANAFEEDADTGEMRAAGVKMRAEGETAYEPHICLRMNPEKNIKTGEQKIVCFPEKDRSGVLACQRFDWPTYETIIAPVMAILSNGGQEATPSPDDAAAIDAQELADQDRNRAHHSALLAEKLAARFLLAESHEQLKAIGKELTPAVKKQLTTADLAHVREAYLTKDSFFKGAPKPLPSPADQGE